jgi:tRNA A37 N6-isopentenylltransferase MiaA
MRGSFFIVGPTATGKSELGADLAADIGGEIISADAFQIYRGLDQLTAKPDAATLARAPHHLIGALPLSEEMNAEKFRQLALRAIEEVHSRRKLAIVVGGSGLYIKALTHGLTDLPASDPKLRAELNEFSLEDLRVKLLELDPASAQKVDLKNRRRVVRAIEIRLLTTERPHLNPLPRGEEAEKIGHARSSPVPLSPRERKTPVRLGPRSASEGTGVGGGEENASPVEDSPWRARTAKRQVRGSEAFGVFVFRNRDELYRRINRRVEEMFEHGVVEEVRAAGSISVTASQMIGLREIRQLLDGKMSKAECIAAIQQATRRYAKRQLTWFRHQTNFPSLNLSLLTRQEALISQKAYLAAAYGND